MAKAKTEFYVRKDGFWTWRRRTANGKITCCAGEGDGFASEGNAKRAWKAVVRDIVKMAKS